MKVLAVHPSTELYGSDRMFLESLSALGDQVTAVLPRHGPLSAAMAARGITQIAIDFPVLRKVELRSAAAALRFLLRFLVAVPRLVKTLRRLEITTVYVSTVTVPVWVLAGRLARCRVVCHVHESEVDMGRASATLLLAPLLLVSRVIAISNDAQAWISAHVPRLVAARVRVVHNGVPQPTCATVDEKRQGGEEKQLVVVGRLSERKGQDVAIKAVGLLRAQGRDVSLTLVGDCFPGYEGVVDALHELVDSSGLSRHVRFVGFTSDASSLVAKADIALVPSRVEPFGLVAVEALMLARPTVVAQVGGLPEIVTDRVTGRVVPPAEPELLAAAVGELLDAPEYAAGLGRAGQLDAMKRFSLSSYQERLRRALD